jgi:hypothetical protein
MLYQAQAYIDAGDLVSACQELEAIYAKCDGEPRPPDFVDGEARDDLANLIQILMNSIGCQ